MQITTVKEIKETLRDGMCVYCKPGPIRIIDAKTVKGEKKVKLMHYSGKTEWLTMRPEDIYTQF
jgi:hypothetical protein